MPSEPLTFRTEMQEDTAVLYLTGTLMAGGTDPLRDEVKALFPKVKRVVLDLTELSRMDSMGLGTIMSLYVSAKAAGVEFKLINLGQRVRELLTISNLVGLFEEVGKYDPRIF